MGNKYIEALKEIKDIVDSWDEDRDSGETFNIFEQIDEVLFEVGVQ